MSISDAELLRRYIEEGSAESFATIVERYLGLVYSAARRQTGSPTIAEDVAQLVFLEISQNAHRIKPGTPLVAWLHLVTRRMALNAARDAMRRNAREKHAAEIAAMKPDSCQWAAVEPLLDEAVESLGEVDRAAILLRYFQNKSLREIGDALGTSEDAAQKRVARAVDRLRTFLLRRGVLISAAGIATDLSAHAIEVAPTGLGKTIISAVTAKVSSTFALAQSTRTLAMTTSQKIIVITTLAVAFGTSIYEASVIARQNTEQRAQQERIASMQRELQSRRAEQAKTDRKLADVQRQLEAERSAVSTNALASVDSAMESALDKWLHDVVRLKQSLDQMPNERIPELQFLTAKDWLDATKEGKLETDMDIRRALCQLRLAAKEHFAPQLATALQRYAGANNGQAPTDGAQLAAYFDSPADPSILQRYGQPTASQMAALPKTIGKPTSNPWIFSEKAPADDYYDTSLFFGNGGSGIRYVSPLGDEVDAAIKSFKSANNGLPPSDPSQIAPYLRSKIDPTFVQLRLDGKR